MLPEANINIGEQLEKVTLPSLTYRLDLDDMRIRGKVDGLEAVKQAVFKIMSTERYRYLIYSSNYGMEMQDLIGKDFDFVRSEVKRRVEDALTIDDRVISISQFEMQKTGTESCKIKFVVQSTEGEFEAEGEVNV